jgi:hypothetical protein
VTGLNELTGETEKIYKAVPSDYMPINDFAYDSQDDDFTNRLKKFNFKTSGHFKYYTGGELILTPTKIDVSEDGCDA